MTFSYLGFSATTRPENPYHVGYQPFSGAFKGGEEMKFAVFKINAKDDDMYWA
jgi:hypothetical protein